jgi:hypothetical protein
VKECLWRKFDRNVLRRSEEKRGEVNSRWEKSERDRRSARCVMEA